MAVVAVVVDAVSSRKVSLSREINVLEGVSVKPGRKVRLVEQRSQSPAVGASVVGKKGHEAVVQ